MVRAAKQLGAVRLVTSAIRLVAVQMAPTAVKEILAVPLARLVAVVEDAATPDITALR